jgi:hypothetical protein
MWKEAVRGYFKIPKNHEYMKDLSQGSRYPVRDSNWAPPEYKSEELRLETGKGDGTVTIYICILEVLGWNLSWNAGNPDWGIPCFSSVPLDKCRNSISIKP